MKLLKWHWLSHSLRNKLILSVSIMTLPIVGMLIYNNFYSIQVVREQVAVSYNDAMSLYMNQIDRELNDADAYINTIALGSDLLSMSRAANNDDYYIAKVFMFNSLSNDIGLYRSVNSFFVYHKQRQDYMDIPRSTVVSNEDKETIQQYIVNLIHQQKNVQGGSPERWKYYQIGEQYYLIDIVLAGDTYLGAWIQADQIITPLRALKMGKVGEILLANDQGEPITDSTVVHENGIVLRQQSEAYYLSGSERKFLVVGTPSTKGNFSLMTIIPDTNILDNLPYLQRIIWIITFASVLLIPVGLYAMRRAFLIPLSRILLAMKKVRGGDWSAQVDMQTTSEEFVLLGDSFNSMMNEVQTLRVNVFEEQLNKQKEELHRLQLQVNPHFFLNTLNLICNLAKVKNYELIIEMTVALIRYFRFLLRSNASFVKLRDELDHARNYLNIQQLRFPEQLAWTIESPVYLSEVAVPPLIIQSFVENSIKHAVTLDKPIGITISIEFLEEEKGSRMRIIIQDTGSGFSDSVLQELQAGRSVQNDQGDHTGIWNVQRRMNLLYNGKALLHFYNDELTGGAVVEMILPTDPVTQ
ncbi:sensor histidine kinase [Paenibacillus sp. YIM B09110]|uniref:sensor histidine kinase n=1 Tax=Paenibacillus sp. YIM B09110 TaxID=3126102 RepID=UPI00301CDDA2